MNKKFLIPLIAVFGLAGVFAIGYVVSNLVLTVGVAEPFTVKYAVIGDAGTYTGGTCADESLDWFTANDGVKGNMLFGESRAFCVRIVNLAEGTVPYAITPTFTNDTCRTTFGNPIAISGTATANVHGETGSLNYNGVVIKPLTSLAPVSDCEVTISVSRE